MDEYIHNKWWGEIINPLPNFSEWLKFRNVCIISSHILQGMWLLMRDGIKFINVNKRDPGRKLKQNKPTYGVYLEVDYKSGAVCG